MRENPFYHSSLFPVMHGADYKGKEDSYKENLSRSLCCANASGMAKGRPAVIRREKLLKWPNVLLNKPFIVDKP
jgi:hypothetical protein